MLIDIAILERLTKNYNLSKFYANKFYKLLLGWTNNRNSLKWRFKSHNNLPNCTI